MKMLLPSFYDEQELEVRDFQFLPSSRMQKVRVVVVVVVVVEFDFVDF